MHKYTIFISEENPAASAAIPVQAQSGVGFKRKRVGVQSNPEDADRAAFNAVFDNCPNIVLLEIMGNM